MTMAMTSFGQLVEALSLMTTYEELTEVTQESAPSVYVCTEGNISYPCIASMEQYEKIKEIENRFEEIYEDVVAKKNALWSDIEIKCE
jgi:hypothetical protein